MSMILLAVEDLDRDAPIRDLLTSEGWWVTTVGSKEEALRAAADHAPQLLILDRGMDDPEGLMEVFSSERGGCGVLVLLDSLDEAIEGESGDGVLARDQEADDLVSIVRGQLDAPRTAPAPPGAEAEATGEDEQLTARELFGDILEDLGETPKESTDPDEADAEVEVEADAEVPEATEEEVADEAEADAEAEAEAPDAPEGEVGEETEVDVEEDTEVEADETAEGGASGEEQAVTDAESALEDEEASIESVEVPVPPDVLAADELEAKLDAAAGSAEPSEEGATAEAGSDPDDSPVEAEDKDEDEDESEDDDGEVTSDLVEEVADLLESREEEWPSSDDSESGEGLSIEEVLAVETSIPESEDPGESESDSVPQPEAEDQTADEIPPDELEGEPLERVGAYELLELAELGDLTDRWLARRAGGNGDRVILERIRSELRTRADVREAFVEGNSDAAGWVHESVLPVVDLGREGDVDFVVTQYRPGHSLAEVLDRVARMEARMPLGVSLLLIERVVEALEVLAASPATSRHGWLVPSSIWLSESGEVLLREFGLGRLAKPDEALVRDWADHRFIAPEKWSHRGDIRSDLYSLGAVFYEMVCGAPVHQASDYEGLVKVIQEGEIAPAQEVDPTIPSEIDAWVMRLLRREPQERPQSMPEIMAKIDLALQALPARPASAELDAYVRQLFAARLPDPLEAVTPASGSPEAQAAPDAEGPETSNWKWQWWWLLLPLLALLSAVVGWKFMFADQSEEDLSRLAPQVIEQARVTGEGTKPVAPRLALE